MGLGERHGAIRSDQGASGSGAGGEGEKACTVRAGTHHPAQGKAGAEDRATQAAHLRVCRWLAAVTKWWRGASEGVRPGAHGQVGATEGAAAATVRKAV
jgi:hypothetical protein